MAKPLREIPAPDEDGTVGPSDAEPGDAEPSPEDMLELNRHRDYVRGRRYEVFVPSPFARNPRYRGEPVLRMRYFVRWETREDGERWPVFATEEEWLELRLAEQTDALRAEGYRAPEQWMTLKEIAAEVGKSERTIRRHIVEREECSFTAFGRTKKVRRSDFEEWLAKDSQESQELRETEEYRRDDF